ncbi:heterokaryon incompatibility protein-domain-containing protein [Boletus reticuloceps]|uniref:Heterokaryon incompatibility protein-domain-containing protein n=1 Tax=Boletus reticuloceps TaxID=495285 RepID=A0A8I2YCT9_9AGAM|nr:heterokaryon incompatibility protein-domain-containing protein [Boletus reticuloceps]
MQAIKLDPSSPWGYDKKHAALHGLQRYDEAIATFADMLSRIERSAEQDIRQLSKKYISPSRTEKVIEDVISGVSKKSPLVLLDVQNGRLCKGAERLRIFKLETQWKELISSVTEELDDRRIKQVVEQYFRYVTLSHVWQGEDEPSYQDVERAESVDKLGSSPLNEKLRKFCQVVYKDGYRWAWSDTCCIDKTNSSVLSESLKSMYKWYQASAATFVLLADVESSSAVGGLTGSKWMRRAWTSQELLAPKVIRFFTRGWQPYLGDTQSNHKKSPEIMQELVDAIGIARQTIITFNPNNLTAREKLRLASTREAFKEEDLAYSLIGIFQSYIHPGYGEGDAALGRLLEEIVARDEVTVLDWAGKSSSSYNSCVPNTLAVYSQPPGPSPAMNDAEMDVRVAALKDSLSKTDVIDIHGQIARLPPVSFSQSRLRLPCIIFTVETLKPQDCGSDLEGCYQASVSGIGNVVFQTSDNLSLKEPRRLIFVHPWIHDLLDPFDGFAWGSTADNANDGELDAGTGTGVRTTSSAHGPPATTMDEYTRALRLVARLQQPFHVLLLQKQSKYLYKRVAAEHKIVVQGIDRSINFARHIHADVKHIM